MRDLRLPLRWVGCLAISLAFSFPAFAQQDDGPMPPVQRQAPVQPETPQPSAAPTTTPQPSAAPSDAAAPVPASAPAAKPGGARIEVPSGTRLPLVLHNGISTHSAKIGDPVYFETLFPIMIDGRVAIPAGSYVSGEVTESKRAGRVKGRAELLIKLNTLILPNAYVVNLNATPRGAERAGERQSITKAK